MENNLLGFASEFTETERKGFWPAAHSLSYLVFIFLYWEEYLKYSWEYFLGDTCGILCTLTGLFIVNSSEICSFLLDAIQENTDSKEKIYFCISCAHDS